MPGVPQFQAPNLGALIQQPNPMLQLLQAASQLPATIQANKANQLQNQLAEQLIQQNSLSLQTQQQQSSQQQQSYAQQRAAQIGATIVSNGSATPQQTQMLTQLGQITGENYLNPDGTANVDYFKKDFHDATSDDIAGWRAMDPYDRALVLKNYKNVDPKFLKERQELDMKTMATIGEIQARTGEDNAKTAYISGPQTAAEKAKTYSIYQGVKIGWAKVQVEMQRTAIMAERAAKAAAGARSGDRTAVSMARSAYMAGLTQLNTGRRMYFGALDELGKLTQGGKYTLSDLAQNPTFGPQVTALMRQAADAKVQYEAATDQMQQAGTLLESGGSIGNVVQSLSGLRTRQPTKSEQDIESQLGP